MVPSLDCPGFDKLTIRRSDSSGGGGAGPKRRQGYWETSGGIEEIGCRESAWLCFSERVWDRLSIRGSVFLKLRSLWREENAQLNHPALSIRTLTLPRSARCTETNFLRATISTTRYQTVTTAVPASCVIILQCAKVKELFRNHFPHINIPLDPNVKQIQLFLSPSRTAPNHEGIHLPHRLGVSAPCTLRVFRCLFAPAIGGSSTSNPKRGIILSVSNRTFLRRLLSDTLLEGFAGCLRDLWPRHGCRCR